MSQRSLWVGLLSLIRGIQLEEMSIVTLAERALGTNWIAGYVGPRTGLEQAEKRNICCPCQKENLNSSVVRQ
jgi:hypothetical protein